MPPDTNLPPPSSGPHPAIIMDPASGIRNLRPNQIFELQAEYEGDLRFRGVSEKDLQNWKSANPEIMENKDIRYEYNFLAETLIIKCMPTATHDSLQIFFTENVFGSLVERLGLAQATGLVDIGSGTTFAGFKGDWRGSSEKLPDAYVKLPSAKFPAVVCEAGWTETHEQLMDDARLWPLHTGGQTRIVIVVSFSENNTRKHLDVEDEKSGDEIQSSRGRSAEQKMIGSIDGSTDVNDLAEWLMDLSQQDKLRKPLVRDLKVTLHVYRACENHEDIIESFGATILPSPPIDTKGPTEFGITLKDILGDYVPEGQDPMDIIVFSLPRLKEFVIRSLPNTQWLRATRRAKKLMIEAGE
ncbi:hypothetical protein L873DRAFT_1849655 [Choiromyces venosus 120613-1]|uniref:Uncharacterized protein n=1 Tax=Choiromyces venosus 120613-1 TaxID=1336337 RepID=A0A3N4ITD2_9PEZI|nr:hypothetical protein L873DRAFT_1849655 [Choiromyces venosus 120613-1]